MKGGYDDELHAPASIHIYDIQDECWAWGHTPSSSSDDHIPLARSFHTTTFVKVDNEPYLFVVGGLHMRADRHNRDRTL